MESTATDRRQSEFQKRGQAATYAAPDPEGDRERAAEAFDPAMLSDPQLCRNWNVLKAYIDSCRFERWAIFALAGVPLDESWKLIELGTLQVEVLRLIWARHPDWFEDETEEIEAEAYARPTEADAIAAGLTVKRRR